MRNAGRGENTFTESNMTTRRPFILVVALFLLGGHHAAIAQDSTRTWSLGVDNQSGVYVGIAVSPTFRLEPEVNVFRSRDKAVITVDNGFGNVSVFNEEVTSASYLVGLGLLWQWQRVSQLRFYAGPRFGVIHATASENLTGAQSGKSDVSRTDWFVAGSLGAEYFPVPRLSAGADVQLRGVAQGNPSQHTTGSPAFTSFAPSESTLSTRGLLLVRFYL
jgi:hypothetical protein